MSKTQAPEGGELPPLPKPRMGMIAGHLFYNADDMQAYARAALAAPAPQAPAALTNEQIAKAAKEAHIAFALGKHQTYEHALTRAVEAAHGIPAPQTKEPTNDR